MIFQCPGCLKSIYILGRGPNRPPIAYLVDSPEVKHKCKELKELRSWLDSQPIELPKNSELYDDSTPKLSGLGD